MWEQQKIPLPGKEYGGRVDTWGVELEIKAQFALSGLNWLNPYAISVLKSFIDVNPKVIYIFSFFSCVTEEFVNIKILNQV